MISLVMVGLLKTLRNNSPRRFSDTEYLQRRHHDFLQQRLMEMHPQLQQAVSAVASKSMSHDWDEKTDDSLDCTEGRRTGGGNGSGNDSGNGGHGDKAQSMGGFLRPDFDRVESFPVPVAKPQPDKGLLRMPSSLVRVMLILPFAACVSNTFVPRSADLMP